MAEERTQFKRFECDTDHNTRKFWEIEKVNNPDLADQWGYTTYWGRVGNKGSAKTKWYKYSWARDQVYSKKLIEKRNKGYVIVSTTDNSPYENKKVEEVREHEKFLKTISPTDVDRLKAIEFDLE